MGSLFVGLPDGVSVHRSPDGVTVFHRSSDPRGLQRPCPIEESDKPLLGLADGRHRLLEVRECLGDAYSDHSFRSTVRRLADAGVIALSERPMVCDLTGSTDYFSPRHLSVEITSYCNLRCRHCYREAEVASGEHIDRTELLGFVEEAAANGVKIVEVTGGECLCHPEAARIISELAAISGIWIVGILSNGWSITDEFIEQISGAKASVAFSLSLDSSREEVHDDFRGARGSFRKVTDAIRNLTGRGYLVRAAMSYIPPTFFDIEDTIRLAKSLGAQAFSFAPVIPDGRGRVYAELYQRFAESVSAERMQEYLDGVHARHGKYIVSADDDVLKAVQAGEANCGLGHRSWAIAPDGDVRPCVMMPAGFISMGNIATSSFEDMCRSEIVRILRDSPPPNIRECDGCDAIGFCPNCLFQALKQTLRRETCKLCDNERYAALVDHVRGIPIEGGVYCRMCN